MGTLNDWVGTIGGTIMGVELIVLLLLMIAINAGLAFGLWWVLRKMNFVHTKIAWALGLVSRTVDKGAGIAAAPVIQTTSAWRGLKAGLHRATHWPKARPAHPATLAPAGTPVPTKPSRAA